MAESIKNQFSKTKFLLKKLLNLKIIDSFLKIGNSQVVKNLLPEKMNRHLLESYNF